MKSSTINGKLFIAKSALGMLICIWLIPILGIIRDNLRWISSDLFKNSSRITCLPILLSIYFIINTFTWKAGEVEIYLSNEYDSKKINDAKKLFITLLIVGFIFLIVLAKYNQGNITKS